MFRSAFTFAAMSSLLLAAPAPAAPAPSSSAPLSKEQVEAIVHDYILAHPEILSQAAELGRQSAMRKVIADSREILTTPYAGTAFDGAAKGDVTIVEFMDYNCHYCRDSVADVDRILAEDPKVRVVYREIPILSKSSVQAARVALLVAEKTKGFSRFHHTLYKGEVNEASIVAAAKAEGISEADAKAAMDDSSRDGELKANMALAQVLNVQGTPVFVIGDQLFDYAMGYEAMKKAVAAARK